PLLASIQKNSEIEKFQRGKSPRFLHRNHSTKSQKEASSKEFKAHSSSHPTTKFYKNQSEHTHSSKLHFSSSSLAYLCPCIMNTTF
ncbi:hypothetical protein LINPERHAP2_LOCUS2731, partial [Linum perenne]